MHIAEETEGLRLAIIDSRIGGEHVVVLPGIQRLLEIRPLQVRMIEQALGTHEHRIREHVDLVLKGEQADLGVIGPLPALYDLALGIPHGRPALKHGHAVLGIVVQVPGAELVPVLVGQLHQGAPELGHIPVYQIVHAVAVEHRVLLHDLDVAPGLEKVGIHVPESSVTEEISVVVQETGGTDDLADVLAVTLYHLGRLGAEEAHQTVCGLLFLSLQTRRSAYQCGGEEGLSDSIPYQSWLPSWGSRIRSRRTSGLYVSCSSLSCRPGTP